MVNIQTKKNLMMRNNQLKSLKRLSNICQNREFLSGILKKYIIIESAESFGLFNVKKEYVPKVIEKNEESKLRITQRLSQAFMFQCLDDAEKKMVVDAMEERQFTAGENIIT